MTPVVTALNGTNVAVLLITSLIPPAFGWLNYLLGLTPELVLTRFMFWQPFTYLFMHGGVGHILINMLILWMFGVQLERLWGSRFFLRYRRDGRAHHARRSGRGGGVPRLAADGG